VILVSLKMEAVGSYELWYPSSKLHGIANTRPFSFTVKSFHDDLVIMLILLLGDGAVTMGCADSVSKEPS
jgi:hypothetical protein